jgi:hypothetical protein
MAAALKVCALAILAAALVVPPADARSKKADPRAGAQRPAVKVERRPAAPPSLDGRVLGRARTCGFDTFLYDGFGVPYGPYCH